jgi:spore germination protein YaaH
MKKFFAFHSFSVLALYATLLVSIVLIYLKWGTFSKFVDPQTNFLSPQNDNQYHLKPIETISYGFLPYWSVKDFNEDLNELTDIAYFSIFLNPNGSIDKNNNHYTVWKNSMDLYSIVNLAKKEGVRLSLTVSIHDNDAIDEFLNCGTPCWELSFSDVSVELDSSDFKGINFDFENVGDTPSTLSTVYSEYISYMSKKLKQEYGKDFLVVVSTYGDSVEKRRITNIESLNNRDVDYLFIMAYDFFRPNSNIAGPVAPLTGANTNYHYDITKMTQDYLKFIDPTKLILGIPTYGINFIVEKPEPYSTRIPGNDFIEYSIQQNLGAIDVLIERETPEIKWDESSKTPYFTYYKPFEGVYRLVFFENDKSIQLKKDFAEKQGFAGVGYWALGYR